jgi:hypothetical protein
VKKDGIKSWNIEDERRAYSSRNPYHKGINNLENIQKVISYRISDIIKKLKVHAQILVIHCTEYEDLFSEKYFDKKECTIEIIRNHNINELVNNYENIIQRNKYDIILFELPVGLKRPNPDDLIHNLIQSKLSKFGVALNVSTQNSFGKRIYDKYPNSLRHRQNILGNIWRYASVNFSLYEFFKYSKNIEEHPLKNRSDLNIECTDFTKFILGNEKYKDIKIYTAMPSDFFDASNTIQQNIIRDKNKNKEFKQLHSLWINKYRCDLTKSNPKRELVKKELKKIENGIFIPTIPSSSNKVEIDSKNLKSWAYWMVVLDPTKINNEYAMSYLNSKLGKEQLMSHAIGSTIKHINSDALSKIGIVFKTLVAQKKITETKKKLEDFVNASVGLLSDLEEKGEDFDFNPENILKKMPDYELNTLINLDESEFLERKETLRKDTKKKVFQNYITEACLKTIVAFLNSKGGKLIVGQKDDKVISGIEEDNFKNNDDWSKFFKDKVKTHIGLTFMQTNIDFKFYKKNEKTIAVINCKKLEKGKQAYLNDQDLYVRVGPSSEKLSAKQALELFNKKNNKN